MEYLPYAHFTDEELLRIVLTKSDLTQFEQELSVRLERALDTIYEFELVNGDDA